MIYSILADTIVIFHLIFILFAIFGGLLFYWRRWILLIHVPAIIWVVLLELNSWICPLTPLENTLRHMSGEAGYTGGFIQHYLVPLIYPVGLTPDMQKFLGFSAFFINAIIYFFIVKKYRQIAN